VPLMPTHSAQMELMPGQVQAAPQSADLTSCRDLLDPNVIWGTPAYEGPGCRNRDQVLTWYRSGRAKGARHMITADPVVGALGGAVVRSIPMRISLERVLTSRQIMAGADQPSDPRRGPLRRRIRDQKAASVSRSFGESRRTWGFGRRSPISPIACFPPRRRQGLLPHMQCLGLLDLLSNWLRAAHPATRDRRAVGLFQ
jgi:hypothetical protein